jgi:hypothetical protein
MIVIFMGQLHPTGGLTLDNQVRVLAYQAINDRRQWSVASGQFSQTVSQMGYLLRFRAQALAGQGEVQQPCLLHLVL